jgi:hypothetical protein
VISLEVQAFALNSAIVEDLAIITGLYHNSHMLWHVMFDFVIPLHYFLRVHHFGTSSSRKIYLRSLGLGGFADLAKILSQSPIISLDGRIERTVFLNAVIGVEKYEPNNRIDRVGDDMITFTYHYNRSMAISLRDSVLGNLGINGTLGPNPLVLVVKRNDTRDLANLEELENHLSSSCPFCDVREIVLQSLPLPAQISLVASAEVLIGRHGSGLVHALWLPEGAHLIEILPFGYSCRNWYQIAAEVAGVVYHSVMNEAPSVFNHSLLPGAEYAELCWNDPTLCTSSACHDFLRDQKTVLNLSIFDRQWVRVVESLRAKFEGGDM